MVTWGLGERIQAATARKRLGVLFGREVEAYIFDFTHANQANYVVANVQELDDGLVVSYRDASLGLEEIGQLTAYSHVDGVDAHTQLPVTVLR